ncbi:c-type heme family protein [Flavobacterium sp.]|uniref:c-type heme family protein n=1 Tax=Flavobacterium sp. TaxID=239 RepID=UPI002FD89CDC
MKYIYVVYCLFLLISCQNSKQEYQDIEEIPMASTFDPLEAKKLMETHCYLCHSPTADENQGRIAPPMVAIKARYIDREGYNKAEFIENVKAFVAHPTEEKALMYGAVKKHGLMPKQAFPEGSIEKIAAFMYDYQIEEPEWFKAHWEGHGNENWTQSGKKLEEVDEVKTYADIGLDYALGTKKVLGKNLMEAIQQKGTMEALTFCNHQAIPLTDSMATQFNANIKRVSDKNRNPNNKAYAEELYYIAQFKKELAEKKESKPIALEKGDKIQFYYPIETNTMCLQCHGKQIKPEVQRQILKLYPKDLAIGYDENEVRGIWSITFTKKTNE